VKPAELRGLSDDDLRRRLAQLRSEWQTLRFDAALGRLTNPMRIRQIRKDIARIYTILTERERQALAERGLLPPPRLTRRERRKRKARQMQQHA